MRGMEIFQYTVAKGVIKSGGNTMRLEYRIHKRGEDYYPQVRSKKLFFWTRWQRIFRINEETYRLNMISEDSPLSMRESELAIDGYDKWIRECHLDYYITYRPEC